MLNLTSSPIMLLTAEGPSDIVLHPAKRTAAEHVTECYILRGERIRTGSPRAQPLPRTGDTARPRRERRRRHGPAAHVAEPHPDPLLAGSPEPIKVSLLIRPPAAGTPDEEAADGDPAQYTLYLDRAGICTDDPATDEIGRAETWEQLQWMARGAAPFEGGGRLWALDNRTRTVLFMADIKLEHDPHASRRKERR